VITFSEEGVVHEYKNSIIEAIKIFCINKLIH